MLDKTRESMIAHVYYNLSIFKDALDKLKMANIYVLEYYIFAILSYILYINDTDKIKTLKLYLQNIQNMHYKINDSRFLEFLQSNIPQDEFSEEELFL